MTAVLTWPEASMAAEALPAGADDHGVVRWVIVTAPATRGIERDDDDCASAIRAAPETVKKRVDRQPRAGGRT